MIKLGGREVKEWTDVMLSMIFLETIMAAAPETRQKFKNRFFLLRHGEVWDQLTCTAPMGIRIFIPSLSPSPSTLCFKC